MDHHVEFCRIVGELARRYDRHEVFNDFCEIAAITLRQVFERNPANEERYLKLIRRYEPEEPPAAPLPAPVPAPLDGPAGQLLFNF